MRLESVDYDKQGSVSVFPVYQRKKKRGGILLKSKIVVISWWSNCLVLQSMKTVLRHSGKEDVLLVQCGKSKASRERLRRFLDERVREIHYPDDRPAEHFQVLEYLVRGPLKGEEGIWFLDHDVFLLGDARLFFQELDRKFQKNKIALFVPEGRTMTNPAFWLSPARLPENCPSFSPVPAKTSRVSRRPDVYSRQNTPQSPEYDTLVKAYEAMEKEGKASLFPLLFFPEHEHIGGLHLLTWDPRALKRLIAKDIGLKNYFQNTFSRFLAFYESCPQEWLALEDESLLKRIAQLR